MKYNQPYGISDPNAAYINGNPSTGTMGSIPPAASIEYPQREIANLVVDAGLVPTNADLHQLGKGVQGGGLNYAPDSGVAGAAIAVLAPVPDAYRAGLVVRFKAINAPGGPVSLDAGHGPQPIIKGGGGALTGGEWSVGDMVSVVNDGAGHWQLPPSLVAMLFASRDYYVNSATGSDANNGLSAGTPFLTLQKAWNTAQLFNLNGYDVNIHVADGTYAKVSGGRINGSGNIYFIGNTANPQNVIVQASVGPAFAFGAAALVIIDGFRVSSLAAGGGMPSAGVWAAGGASVTIRAVDFGNAVDAQILADVNGYISIWGPIRIFGSSTGHMLSYNQSAIRGGAVSPTLTILNAVAYSGGFAVARDLATMQVTYASIAGAANVTGPRYAVLNNGVINTVGSGANYYPGTIAGTASTGGQYV